MVDCIFVNKPEECSVCLESKKLQCLVNKHHLKISNAGATELRRLLEEEINTPRRYKTKSGQAGRQ